MSFLEMAKALRSSAISAESAVSARSPANCYQPLTVDHDLAERLGREGSRREFLQAVELVAELSDRPRWSTDEALEALADWWRMPPEKLQPVQWVLSAARADEVMGRPSPRAERHIP